MAWAYVCIPGQHTSKVDRFERLGVVFDDGIRKIKQVLPGKRLAADPNLCETSGKITESDIILYLPQLH